MPFQRGNKFGKGRPKGDSPKTIWLLQSLASHGVDLQALLAKSLIKASQGDRQATDLAHLLAKLLPHVANAPKADAGQVQIETLVINRFDKSVPVTLPEGGSRLERGSPSIDTEVVNDPSQD